MDYADVSLIVELTAKGRLDRSPKANWVENAGGLPKYIEDIAVEIEKSGKTVSQAISIAISRVKTWAAGGDNVKPDTRAKAAKAVAEWEKLKAKNAAKKVAATVAATEDHVAYEVLSLSAESYNISKVTSAWDSAERARRQTARQARQALRAADPMASVDYEDDYSYRHVRETWSDFLIVTSGYDASTRYWKVPYTVSNDGSVSFAPEEEVKVEYTATTSDIQGVNLSGESDEQVELARHVKTAEGARLFGQPIGSVISADKLKAVKKAQGRRSVNGATARGQGDTTQNLIADTARRLAPPQAPRSVAGNAINQSEKLRQARAAAMRGGKPSDYAKPGAKPAAPKPPAARVAPKPEVKAEPKAAEKPAPKITVSEAFKAKYAAREKAAAEAKKTESRVQQVDGKFQVVVDGKVVGSFNSKAVAEIELAKRKKKENQTVAASGPQGAEALVLALTGKNPFAKDDKTKKVAGEDPDPTASAKGPAAKGKLTPKGKDGKPPFAEKFGKGAAALRKKTK